MFIRCLQCNWIGMPKETKEDGQCPHCSCTGYLMELDSDSSFTDYDLEQLWDAFGDTAMIWMKLKSLFWISQRAPIALISGTGLMSVIQKECIFSPMALCLDFPFMVYYSILPGCFRAGKKEESNE